MAKKKKSKSKKSGKKQNPSSIKADLPKTQEKEFFEDQLNDDQCKYSRYVCDSRAIPHEIDGLKPVQRRILWTMWNSTAKNHFTKTVKVAGLVMAYHPHGDRSIQDAISAMVQEFPFANNHALISGEGTFGDVLDPGAIASPRYTEVRLSDFAKDVGLFDCLEDIEYVNNYDETSKEPVFFCAKIPLVLLNAVQGIATGFRCSIPSFRLRDIVNSLISYLKSKRVKKLSPWVKGYNGHIDYSKNQNRSFVFTTSFGYTIEGKDFFITDAPQNWNREKVVRLLDKLIDEKSDWLKGFSDHSQDQFKIELHLARGVKPDPKEMKGLMDVSNSEVTAYNMITTKGTLQEIAPEELIRRFAAFRKAHLIKRFKRLAGLEKEKVEKNSELIRFIQEGWNQRVIKISSKSKLEGALKKAKFNYFTWLSSLPIYRLTLDEVKKCEQAIEEAKKQYAYFTGLVNSDKKLVAYMVEELTELKEKWDKT
jgi:DNA gyrase subunit A